MKVQTFLFFPDSEVSYFVILNVHSFYWILSCRAYIINVQAPVLEMGQVAAEGACPSNSIGTISGNANQELRIEVTSEVTMRIYENYSFLYATYCCPSPLCNKLHICSDFDSSTLNSHKMEGSFHPFHAARVTNKEIIHQDSFLPSSQWSQSIIISLLRKMHNSSGRYVTINV